MHALIMKTMARTRVETLKDQEQSIHEEARMVLPGVQALFGFQLIAVFNQRFADMEAADRGIYFLSLLLVTGAIGLLMAPAAFHRLAERQSVSEYFVDVSSKLIAASMLPLAIAIAMDVYLVACMAFATSDVVTCAAIAAAVFVALSFLWFIFPLYRAFAKDRRGEPRRNTNS